MAYASSAKEAKERAISNARYFCVPYGCFIDTAGNHQVERENLTREYEYYFVCTPAEANRRTDNG